MAMPEPEHKTLADLTSSDIGRIVKFRRPDPDDRGLRVAQGELASFREVPYMQGMMPKPGFIIRLSFGGSSYRRGGEEEHGPLLAAHKIDVFPMTRPGRWRRAPQTHTFGSPRRLGAAPESEDLDEAMSRLRDFIGNNEN